MHIAAADGNISAVSGMLWTRGMYLVWCGMVGNLNRLCVNIFLHSFLCSLIHLYSSPLALVQVKLLLGAGANVLATDRWQDSPLDDAKRAQAMPVVRMLEPLVQEAKEAEGTAPPQTGPIKRCEPLCSHLAHLSTRPSTSFFLSSEHPVTPLPFTSILDHLAGSTAGLPDSLTPSPSPPPWHHARCCLSGRPFSQER